MDKHGRLAAVVAEPELRHDVLLHLGRRGRGKGDDRRGAQGLQVLPEHPVVGPEIMAPLRDAVGFVDGDQTRLALRKHLRKARHPQPFRRDEQEVERSVQVASTGFARGFARQPRVDPGDVHPELVELGCLVIHERDQWRNDERGAAASKRRQLVAQGFACAGWHHQQHIGAVHGRGTHSLLVGAERTKTEPLFKQCA